MIKNSVWSKGLNTLDAKPNGLYEILTVYPQGCFGRKIILRVINLDGEKMTGTPAPQNWFLKKRL